MPETPGFRRILFISIPGAIAADYLSRHGKVLFSTSITTKEMEHRTFFYNRSDVLTLSIHGHPKFAYPISPVSGKNGEQGRAKA
jgi:hypothetical protein